MNAASTSAAHAFRPQLLERRTRLQAAASSVSADYLNDLIGEIDAALHRIDDGSFGFCETCHDTIEADRLECMRIPGDGDQRSELMSITIPK